MTSVSDLIRTTSLVESQTKFPIPSYLISTVNLFEKAHVIYRSFKFSLILKKSQEKPLEGNPFVYGSAINVLAPATDTTAYALQIALISKSVSDIVKQYEELHQSYHSFQDAYKNRFTVYVPDAINSKEPSKAVSPTLKKMYKDKVSPVPSYLAKVGSSLANLYLQVFKMAMCLEDVRLLTSGDPSQKNHACTELVAEWQEYRHNLQSKSFLVKEMNDNNILVDKILSKIDHNTTASSLINLLKQGIQELSDNQTVQELAETAHETIGELIGNENAPLLIQYNFNPQNVLGNQYAAVRYPPWAGQKIELNAPAPLPPPTATPSPSSLTPAIPSAPNLVAGIKNTGLSVAQELQSDFNDSVNTVKTFFNNIFK